MRKKISREFLRYIYLCFLTTVILAAGCGSQERPVDSGNGGFCAELGLVSRPFDENSSGEDFGEKAGDFSLETLDGTWALGENWTGCENYLFITYNTSYDYLDSLFDSSARDVERFLESSPENTRYFFMSYRMNEDSVISDIESINATIEEGLARMEESASQYWRSRIHYVTESAMNLEGWMGALVDKYNGWPFAIDRFQTIRELGYFADPVTSWSEVPLEFVSYEPIFFNFEADRQEMLEAESATVLGVFEGEPVSSEEGGSIEAIVGFPDAETMAGFDKMELDLTLACGGHLDYANCPEWDILVQAFLCEEEDTDICETEIGRWVTAYARPGRWITDVSPFLALLSQGGERKIRFSSGQDYLVTLDIRLSNQDSGVRPYEAVYLWSGGGFDETYNDLHPPITFTAPDEAARVDLVAVISGHGWGMERANCAEFCNHQHEFTINGTTTYMKEHPEAGTAYGCAERVGEGVVPNQYGTWVFGRGGWCPGLEVKPWVVDITDDVIPGTENTIEYRGLVDGEAYIPEPNGSQEGFNAVIYMDSYLVYWK